MEFEHSEKVRALQARVEAFMADEVYPNEEALFAQVNEGDRWQPGRCSTNSRRRRARPECGTCSCRKANTAPG